ncbi:MAG: undecaprenyldiphospho-muramoylpentapeptide beta-N-acetylglucosaminyltransferase [Clostridiales bacterium]|jgi:UDP-N-acetylglucosamine--N-acetylmuramyl-(pentapeptide) pyrophosphoryl-undecaprenol N-acetylglucosamine transferase|nr:undecaprenyldiphospho-muramoylpentapeptide beta-N-acetylglucosaminyltransferase [Clostridiales bacterium]
MKKILLTGGGTAGHVTPHLALLPALRESGFEAHYVGSVNGIERKLVESHVDEYHAISSGKLRRYFDLKNITDAFRVVKGLGEAFAAVKKIKPDVVFSKGGYVTVPVVIAAKFAGVPAVIHESDITPGLANRLAFPFAKRVCVNFPETLSQSPRRKSVLTGTPIREELFRGDRFKAAELCGFPRDEKPAVLFTGGSLGAKAINQCLRQALPEICKRFKVIHLCGKGNKSDRELPGYAQFEYVTDELPHLLAIADVVVSRAGANTLFELLALRKPNLLIPLTLKASRGDQILNAASFEQRGYSIVLHEEDLSCDTLMEGIQSLYEDRRKYAARMSGSNPPGAGVKAVMEVIQSCVI